jgi:polyisoprenoid-binding protein YceI
VAPEAPVAVADASVASPATAPEAPKPSAESPSAPAAPTHGSKSPRPPALPAAKPEPAPSAPPAAAPAQKSATYQVESSGRASFLIDAPLEKIKGAWSRLGGEFTVDPAHLDATRGEVTLDLSTLKITTFEDPNQNQRQAEHAINWMEIGNEVSADVRAKNRTARFRVEKVVSVTPAAFGAGSASALATLSGTLTLHGITSPQEVLVEVSAEGDPGAPSALRVVSKKPLTLSLKHHDVKPRDLAGRFISGALEQVGQKISDTVQVSFDFRATRR